MTKLAICYWGMTRSTKFVYDSHIRNLFNVLSRHNIEHTIFMHTWKVEGDANIIWEQTIPTPVDYDEYKLLNPQYYKIECQTEFKNSLNFSDYFNQSLYEQYGGDTPHEWRPQLIMNHLCALESQRRVFKMVKDTNQHFDFVMFVRPDMNIQDEFNPRIFNQPFDIVLPNYDHHEGLNDRFAMVPFDKAHFYACRIEQIKEFRKNHGRIVSEKYVKYIVNTYYTTPLFIPFRMFIVRPNGVRSH